MGYERRPVDWKVYHAVYADGECDRQEVSKYLHLLDDDCQEIFSYNDLTQAQVKKLAICCARAAIENPEAAQESPCDIASLRMQLLAAQQENARLNERRRTADMEIAELRAEIDRLIRAIFRVFGLQEPFTTERAAAVWKNGMLIHHPDKGGKHDDFIAFNDLYKEVVRILTHLKWIQGIPHNRAPASPSMETN